MPTGTIINEEMFLKDVWYKWEPTEDSNCPFVTNTYGDLVFGDGSKWEYQDISDFNWDTNVSEREDAVVAFKIR